MHLPCVRSKRLQLPDSASTAGTNLRASVSLHGRAPVRHAKGTAGTARADSGTPLTSVGRFGADITETAMHCFKTIPSGGLLHGSQGQLACSHLLRCDLM